MLAHAGEITHTVFGAAPKLRFDLKQAVIFCNTLTAARRTRLDKPAAERNGDVRYKAVGRLTASV